MMTYYPLCSSTDVYTAEFGLTISLGALSGFVFVGWMFSFLVSVSSLVFWLEWPVVKQKVSA